MNKQLCFIVSLLIVLSMSACGNTDKKNNNDNPKSTVSIEDTKKITDVDSSIESEIFKTESSSLYQEESMDADSNIDFSEDDESYEEENWFAYFNHIQYLYEDDKYLLTTMFEEKYLFDFDGYLYRLDNTSLKSSYPSKDEYDRMVNIYGEDITNRFIKDSNSQEVVMLPPKTLQSQEQNDFNKYIWVKNSVETPEGSEYKFIAYDDSGNEKFCITNDIFPIENSFTISYLGDSVYKIGDGKYTTDFYVNIETGEYFEGPTGYDLTNNSATDFYSDGFIKDGNVNIMDVHGNSYKVTEKIDSKDLVKPTIHNTGDGLFYCSWKKKFYDYSLNEKIDLSNYNITYATGEYDKMTFKNGYCIVNIKNESGVEFCGIIDTKGETILDYQKDYIVMSMKKLGDDFFILMCTDEKHIVHTFIYDKRNKEIRKNSSIEEDRLYNFMSGSNDTVAITRDGRIIYIDELYGELYQFDPYNDTTTKVKLELKSYYAYRRRNSR